MGEWMLDPHFLDLGTSWIARFKIKAFYLERVRKIIKISGKTANFLAKIQIPGLSNVKQKMEPRSSLYESHG
jgi:hypothetical protein